ncbi:MAG: PilZ domain-containing protein [Gammaproteobacteria bacterium]
MSVNPDTDGIESDCLLEPLETHYSHLADASVLVDLRKHPRFDTRFPAEVVSASGRKTHATITNLSRSGLRLEGGRKMLDDLFPDFNRQAGHTTSPLQVSFVIPDGSDNHLSVMVQCKSAYIRREKMHSWQIGVSFTAIDAGKEALTKYLLLRGETG